MGRGSENVQHRRLVSVNPKARNFGKGINLSRDGGDSRHGLMGEDRVVGKRPDGRARDTANIREEGIIGDNKKEGRKGTALLNATANGNGEFDPALQVGPDANIGHKTANNVNNPVGHAYLV